MLALTSVGTPLSLAAGAGASPPASHASVTGPPATSSGPARSRDGACDGPRVPAPTYTVQPGDTLWRIADDLLGDGADWTSLAALNLGRDVATGVRFVDPDRSARVAPAAAAEARRSATATRRRGGARAVAPDVPPICPSFSRSASGPWPAPHWPGVPGTGAGSARGSTAIRRCPLPSEGAVDTATLLQRFAGAPALQSFEAANCLLGLSVEGRSAGPKVRAICVSSSGVTFWLAGRFRTSVPGGFDPVQRTGAPGTSATMPSRDEPSFPYVPVVLPIGDDREGTWFVPLEPGDVLPVLGEAAPALWRAARAAVGSWAWSDTSWSPRIRTTRPCTPRPPPTRRTSRALLR